MKLHIKSLLCILSLPMLAATADPSVPAAPAPLDRNPYPTQPNTHELPPRYSAPAGVNATARLAYWSEQA